MCLPSELNAHAAAGLLRRTLQGRVWGLMAVYALLLLAGCGYSPKELFPKDVHTVDVRIFDNRTFYRGVEFDLTEALTKEIELRTPYKKVGPDAADTILQGTITSIGQRTLSETRQGGLPEEMEVTLTADFEWKNVRTGKTLRQRQGFVVVARYIPTTPIGEMFSAAQHQAVQKLAQEIVSTLRSDW